jgi:hypothetical protein
MNPAFTSFNSGELSPLMEGRIDFAKYNTGCSKLLNFVPTVQGPIRRRQGTRFVAETKDSGARAWIARFEFNVTQSFILEFGHLYIRFYTNHGQVMSGPTPYEIVSPYTSADLITAEGTFALSMVQSADIIYIAHRNYPPRKLSRLGNTNWTLTELDAIGGPFADQNKDDTITVYADVATGAVTLTASSAIFTANDVGSLFQLEQMDSANYAAWEVNREFPLGSLVTSDGKFYIATSSPVGPATKQYSGTLRPVHIEGRAFDGSHTNGPVQQETLQTVGIEWEYQHSGYGYVRITGFTSPTVVAGTVIETLPGNVVGASNVTSKWNYGDWSQRNLYPSHATFFRERLTFAGGQKLWFSVVGDYENFTPKQSNVVVDDDSINVRISSDQVNDVTWLVSGGSLLIGTGGGEFACGENSSSDPFATRNIKIAQQSRFGGRNIQPQVVSAQTLFVQRAGKKLRDIAYSFEQDSFGSNDVTVLSEHLTRPGIVQLSYQQEPDTVVWANTAEGVLLGLTYNREQDVTSWHPHWIGGAVTGGPEYGIVESIQVVPTPDGNSEELWMIVRRTVNGATKRYVEYLSQNWQPTDAINTAVFLDSSLQYSGAPTTTISGLDHLEGQTVSVLADGATHPDRVVVSGDITLQVPASVVQVGLNYRSIMTTMKIEAGATQGTSQGQKKKFGKVRFRFLGTVGAKYGIDGVQLDEIPFRDSSMPMDQAVVPFTGDKECQWPIGWEEAGRLTVIQEQPLPMTLIGIYPEMKTSA